MRNVKIHIEEYEIPENLKNKNYLNDDLYRNNFKDIKDTEDTEDTEDTDVFSPYN